ncbi:tyrosine-type recombinase/integrase [endosymbiont GvMRE of Glomus versiforme]|uniref:tyrosine-type recombinase/integrase n=1 Tax=endosymbiont GvMRE of Glomus versiforme TaxID=2039283 RepID=UPI00155A0067|nr:tyrosine-type recombinase/integrase [endosymbiont GvMRE of Glomus versiforme]
MNEINLEKYLEWLKEKNYSAKSIRNLIHATKKYASGIVFTNEELFKLTKCLSQKLEPNTCRGYIKALKTYAKFKGIKDIEWEKILKLIPKIQKKFYTTINQQELELLKSVKFEEKQAIYERNNLILDFLFYSGLRINELINLKHQNYQDSSLKIHGKGNKVRYIFLPVFLIKHIDLGSPDYLFTKNKKQKLGEEAIRKFLRRRVKLAGINKWISPHTFRRSLATNLYNKNGRLETIQKQLGHSNIQTTMGYIHNDHNTLYQDYSKIFKENQNQPNLESNEKDLEKYSTDELLNEISRRVGGKHA